MSMSIDEAIESLKGIDLEHTPPCETWVADFAERCGKPSTARIRYRCLDCGWQNCMFACDECREDFKDGTIMCYKCPSFNLTWSVI